MSQTIEEIAQQIRADLYGPRPQPCPEAAGEIKMRKRGNSALHGGRHARIRRKCHGPARSMAYTANRHHPTKCQLPPLRHGD